jgi:tetratricopeptide (TPR) repeat protein
MYTAKRTVIWSMALSFTLLGIPFAPAQDAADIPEAHSFSGAYLAARTATTDRDLPAAIKFYEKALKFEPELVDLKRELMLALIANGEFERALPWADQLKKVSNLERYSRLILAVDAARKRELTRAEQMLKLADKNDLDNLVAEVMTAWTKAAAGDTKAAQDVLKNLQGPEWYALFRNHHAALIAELAGDKPAAGTFYKQLYDDRGAGQAAPDTWARGVEGYVAFLARQGSKDEALKVLDDAGSAIAPRAAQSLRERIDAGTLKKSFVASPQAGMAEILLDIAVALSRPGSEDTVGFYLELARALDPKNDRVLIELGQNADQAGQHERALAFYEAVPEDASLRRISELQLALSLSDLDRNDEARDHLKRLVESDPTDRTATIALGSVYAGLKDYRSAADVYDRAVAGKATFETDDWNLFFQRGIAYERLKEWDKAEPNFRRAMELSPDQPQVLNYLGYSWVDMNINLDEGLTLIKRAVDLRPEDGYIVDSLGWAFFRLARYDEAVQELQRAVELRPEDPTIMDHLGDAFWRVGREREAVFKWRTALGLDPDADVKTRIEAKLKDGLPLPVMDAPVEKKAEADADKGTQIAAADPAPVVDPAQNKVTVKRGESLWDIAERELGNGARFTEILEMNPTLGGNPSSVQPDMELLLPPRDR